MTTWWSDAVERDVVRHERVRDVPLDDRMPGIGCDQLVAGVHHRLRVVQRGRRVGQGAEHVERREGPGRVLNPRRRRRDLRPQRLEDRELALEDLLVGAEDFFLVVLQRRA